jgi:thiamine-monophosphate kinase
LPAGGEQIVGIGDDAAVIRAPDARVVATTDLLVEGRHFRRDWSGPLDIGRKAAAQNLADVAAMGAAPTALLVGFATPGDLAVEWAKDLVRGLAEECARAGAWVAGGDVTSAEKIMLGITALGDLAGRDPVTRSGARPGDRLAVAGILGSSAAGFALLAAGLAGGPAGLAGGAAGLAGGATGLAGSAAGLAGGAAGLAGGATGLAGSAAGLAGGATGLAGSATDLAGGAAGLAGGADLAELVTAHRRPRPRYEAGPQAALLGATSMIDISDGLVQDLGHVAEASGVLIDILADRLAGSPVVRAAALRAAARALGGADWLSWVLSGGEDHALAATFPAGTALPAGWSVIGTVGAGSGVLVDGHGRDDLSGWDHFRG